jgi:predicted RNase H-like HicB family nuclease
VKYRVNIFKTEAGFAVWVPGLPGCRACGETEEEALDNIKSAILSFLDALEEQNSDLEYRYVEVV